ncbi:MAG: hypothetical protein FGM41_02895 [Bacteroidetes bacterium]|jgi:hypothetical protein|nr:hypothetical protein [Bacteroidota bacterium]
MDANQMKDQMKDFVNNWQARLEEMQMQFSLGKMDATEAFEKQKDQLRGMLVGMKDNLDKATDMAEDKTTEMRTKLEELRVQLALGKADGMDAFEAQRKQIELAMHELYVAGKHSFSSNYEKGLEMFDRQSEAFKTGLDIVKIQYSLAKMDAKDEAEEKRKELNDKIVELNNQFKGMQQTAMDNMEEMNRQLRDNFEKMKVYAEGWFKK